MEPTPVAPSVESEVSGGLVGQSRDRRALRMFESDGDHPCFPSLHGPVEPRSERVVPP